MESQRAQARKHWKGSGEEAISAIYKELIEEGVRTKFSGYLNLEDQGEVLALIRQGEVVEESACGETVEVITTTTPCYGESGGQVGDTGEIITAEAALRIIETRKPLPELYVHVCEVVTGAINKGDKTTIKVNAERRQKIILNHTATHLLQAALQNQLGQHVKQAGSLVTPERLRFDFTHFSPVSAEELRKIEEEVNLQIRVNAQVESREMSADAAQEAGAMALFGEKYGDVVRVINVGDYSMELCGGTHARAAGDIGLFRILSEGGIAAGVRRIEAVTGATALTQVQQQQQSLQRLADLVKSDPQKLELRLQKLLEQQKEMEKELEQLQAKANADRSGELINKVQLIEDVKLLAVKISGTDGKGLREFSDQLRDKLGSGVLVLVSDAGGKVSLLVAVTKDLTDQVKAGDLIKPLAEIIGGRGGGRPELAQAGGSEIDKIEMLLQAVPEQLKKILS
jgi:alanyl-tRNA synthetase